MTGISGSAFKNNKKLKTVTIGKNVKKIGSNSFNGANVLKNISITSKGLKSVEWQLRVCRKEYVKVFL
ncbi:leucine-rich repeat protein [uncultured Robinsoniella sp.]|uniref:leucine-rich repeat protein n=1 Tax=uncultured Robinsoniella sp. TaxID=904190 RepID=UPI00374F8869